MCIVVEVFCVEGEIIYNMSGGVMLDEVYVVLLVVDQYG